MLHSFGCTKIIFSHYHNDFIAQTCQVTGFFTSSIAATYNGHNLSAIKKAIARCTGRNSKTFIFFFGRQPQVFSCSASRNNDSICFNPFLIVDQYFERFN